MYSPYNDPAATNVMTAFAAANLERGYNTPVSPTPLLSTWLRFCRACVCTS